MAKEPKPKTAEEEPKKPTTAVAAAAQSLPADVMNDLMADAGRDTFKAEDVALPYVAILQTTSDQTKKQKANYIEGAEVGMFVNTATERLFKGDKGIHFIIAKSVKEWVEWKPEMGGFVRNWGQNEQRRDQSSQNENGRWITPDGNDLVETGVLYVLVLDLDNPDSIPERAIISLSGTQFKKFKKLNAMITSFVLPRPDGKGTFTPACFARSYTAVSVPEENDKGDWFGWKISAGPKTHDLPNGAALYQAAKAFRDLIDKGEVKVAPPPGAESGSGKTVQDDDIPF